MRARQTETASFSLVFVFGKRNVASTGGKKWVAGGVLDG